MKRNIEDDEDEQNMLILAVTCTSFIVHERVHVVTFKWR